ncbi:MAG: VWA domain-containing protein [Solirubrobacteraceae bacterium]
MSESERSRRWRLVLGEPDETAPALAGIDLERDRVLAALYEQGGGLGGDDQPDQRRGGLERSAPRAARWLGDVRKYFPTGVVRVMQRDAVQRLGLGRLLLEPELLEVAEPDINLVATLMSLRGVIPEHSRATARIVVRKVVDDLERRLSQPTRTTITGAVNRAARTRRPRRPSEIDWDRTIRANLRHYQSDYRTVIPETLIGFARRTRSVARHVILLIDQSGSMASSVVYASVFGAVLASMRTLETRLIAFDTAVVDLTEELGDPVDVIFGVQLGGGTDINRALAHAQELITRPNQTVVILISDLIEGGVRDQMLSRCQTIVASGAQMIALLALSDSGTPAYDHDNAAALTELGVPVACTPDLFGELMAAAIEQRDIRTWAADRGLGR